MSQCEILQEMVKEEQGIGVQPGRVVKEGVDVILDKIQQELDETMSWLEEFEKQERKRTGIPSLEVQLCVSYHHF